MVTANEYDKAIEFLKRHSADEIRHFNGSLLAHLESTYGLLRDSDFLERHGAGLERLLRPCKDLVSEPAYASFLDTFGRN